MTLRALCLALLLALPVAVRAQVPTPDGGKHDRERARELDELVVTASPLQPGSEPSAQTALLTIKSTSLSGSLKRGSLEGEVTGEILNLSDAPHLLAEPITLRLNATGDSLGTLQFSGLVDHRQSGKEQDTFNLTLKNATLSDFELTRHPEFQVILKKATLSMDVAGSLQPNGTLELNLRSVFSALETEIHGTSADNEIIDALAQVLQSMPEISVSAMVKGSAPKPELDISSNLDEVLADALGASLEGKAAEVKQALEGRLETELTTQLARLEEELAKSNALLNQAAQQGAAFEKVLASVTST